MLMFAEWKFVAPVAQRDSAMSKGSKCMCNGMGRCTGFCQKGSHSPGSSAGISAEAVWFQWFCIEIASPPAKSWSKRSWVGWLRGTPAFRQGLAPELRVVSSRCLWQHSNYSKVKSTVLMMLLKAVENRGGVLSHGAMCCNQAFKLS